MAKVGAQRAAELTGKSKSTIQRGMKSGKLSFEKDKNNRRVIDVAELERVYGIVPQETGKSDQSSVEKELEKATQMLEIERLKMRIKMLEDQLEMTKDQTDDLKDQRDQWQKQAQQTLITSQYSQKQAENLAAEIKERDRLAKIRRQQAMEKRQADSAMRTQNNHKVVGNREKDEGQQTRTLTGALDVQGLWQKIRGQSSGSKDAA